MESESIYSYLTRRGVSRRDFLKFCGTTAATLGLCTSGATQIAEALEEAPFLLSELVGGTVDALRPQAMAKGLALSAELVPGSADALIGDALRTALHAVRLVRHDVRVDGRRRDAGVAEEFFTKATIDRVLIGHQKRVLVHVPFDEGCDLVIAVVLD